MNISRCFLWSIIWSPFVSAFHRPFIQLTRSRMTNGNTINMSHSLGKSFEKAICLLYNTPFHGNRQQYNINNAKELMGRSLKLKTIYPDMKHVTNYASKYDFIIENSDEKYLNAKTTKTRGKVCPQVLGQCTRKSFCQHFNITNQDIVNVKEFIEGNVSIIIKKYFENTFLCPILYYNENMDKLSIIKLRQGILWEKYQFEFSHLQRNKIWASSTTLYIIDEFTEENIQIGEFQIHTNRDIIKFRWYFENLLEQFPEKFDTLYL